MKNKKIKKFDPEKLDKESKQFWDFCVQNDNVINLKSISKYLMKPKKKHNRTKSPIRKKDSIYVSPYAPLIDLPQINTNEIKNFFNPH